MQLQFWILQSIIKLQLQTIYSLLLVYTCYQNYFLTFQPIKMVHYKYFYMLIYGICNFSIKLPLKENYSLNLRSVLHNFVYFQLKTCMLHLFQNYIFLIYVRHYRIFLTIGNIRGKSLLELRVTIFLPDWQLPLIFVWFISNFFCMCSNSMASAHVSLK